VSAYGTTAVARRLAFALAFQRFDPRFQLGNLHRQQADDRLSFRRLAGNDFFRNSKRHATGVAENASRVQINS
jgi:hypothetical protein